MELSVIFIWLLVGVTWSSTAPSSPVAEGLESDIVASPSDVIYYLYTRITENDPQVILNNDANQLVLPGSAYNPARENYFLIHGYTDNSSSQLNKLVTKAALIREDCNVFFVDWSARAFDDYLVVRRLVPSLGQIIGDFINLLKSIFGVSSDRFTIAAHSVGAHIAGCAGATVNPKLKQIVGLDPARVCYQKTIVRPGKEGPRGKRVQCDKVATLNANGIRSGILSAGLLPPYRLYICCNNKHRELLFDLDPSNKRLDINDAAHVQVIHTSAQLLGPGWYKPLGHADFFPNGGHDQNGCPFELDGNCSHTRAYEYYAESINSVSGFVARKCGNYTDYVESRCNSNPTALMGRLEVDLSALGQYYLITNGASPYARG